MASAYPVKEEMQPMTQQYNSYNRATPPSYIVTGQPHNAESAPLVAPPGAPTLGMYVEERYCGPVTWLITIFASFPCAYFCPCDRRTVWVAGDLKYNEKGAVVDNYPFLNPCPPGSCCNRN